MIGAVTIAHYALGLNAVLAFWIALHPDRPSAPRAAICSQPLANGGLGLETVGTSTIFLVTILGLVGYLSAAQNRVVKAL